jgi:hypothetical protein
MRDEEDRIRPVRSQRRSCLPTIALGGVLLVGGGFLLKAGYNAGVIKGRFLDRIFMMNKAMDEIPLEIHIYPPEILKRVDLKDTAAVLKALGKDPNTPPEEVPIDWVFEVKFEGKIKAQQTLHLTLPQAAGLTIKAINLDKKTDYAQQIRTGLSIKNAEEIILHVVVRVTIPGQKEIDIPVNITAGEYVKWLSPKNKNTADSPAVGR